MPVWIGRACWSGLAPTSFARVSYFTSTALDVGMAVLAYSKRGCGNSTGVYRRFSVEASEQIFGELAADANSARRWLKNQPEVDPERVGFIGGSQAGWISPLAAIRESVAFIVSLAGTFHARS